MDIGQEAELLAAGSPAAGIDQQAGIDLGAGSRLAGAGSLVRRRVGVVLPFF